MTMTTKIARADVVGSLLRPAYLKEARQGVRKERRGAIGQVRRQRYSDKKTHARRLAAGVRSWRRAPDRR